ncbi:hypothetical protein LQZ18_15310 [Lachnospiraceae bacterium ZAX-1]
MPLRQIVHLSKKGYNIRGCDKVGSGESIAKACRELESMLAGVVPTGSDR